MEFDKRTILAFLLIGLIFVIMSTDYYKRLVQPTKKVIPKEEIEKEVVAKDKGLEPSEEEPAYPLEAPAGSVSRAKEKKGDLLEEAHKYSQLLGAGETVTVETNLYKAMLSTQGATLRSWTLRNYIAADSSQVQLIGEDGFGNLALLVPTFEDTIDTSPFVFSVNKHKIVLGDRNVSDQLEFELNLGENRSIKKIFTFYQDRYSVDLKVELHNFDRIVEGFRYYLIWRTGLRSTEHNFVDDMNNAHGYALQGDLEKFDAKDKYKSLDDPTDWVAIRTKYFSVVVIPEEVKAEAVNYYGEQIPVSEKKKWKKYGFDLQMPFYDEPKNVNNFTLYVGPLDYDILKSYQVQLEKMMSFGWAPIRPFAKFVLWSFKEMHKVIPNYGWVIVVFSILIKLVLYPLTRKSYKSMKEMQALQPEMQKLNEKYKNEPQKKQQELMKLYKEHGVNPLGGCIPMLLQMPLLIALFNVFRSTIQLRGAHFIWWIQDLSRPDTVATLPFSLPLYGNLVNILPLFMGITMFVQQKISMKDPKQKAMIYFMPVFFTLLFNSFPSGLNLYYALFNLFSIFQEKLIPYHPKSDNAAKTGKAKVEKRNAFRYNYYRRKLKKF
ncbi:MAG: membrane protein insertase YidC [bacterium]